MTIGYRCFRIVSSWRPSIRKLVDGNAAINKQSAAKTQQKGKKYVVRANKKAA